eukprot:2529714-Amphidinium_carterae.1
MQYQRLSVPNPGLEGTIDNLIGRSLFPTIDQKGRFCNPVTRVFIKWNAERPSSHTRVGKSLRKDCPVRQLALSCIKGIYV